ncbi:uncharacterized protein LOC124266831 isoform X2 [Haliotis rubra]|uniref:uncharacterized protein LOC124266831 isoform X2 n=1 Tax=Haliotis rubra TaxID=36100 RepID=UPI001EE576A2|nr:uncharacterized protein LOC124266831 isoform X2 [Haliotis rubra]
MSTCQPAAVSTRSGQNMSAKYEDVQIKMEDEDAKTADYTSEQTQKPNPYVVQHENTGVRLKIPNSGELVPKPWRSIKQVIVASYLSLICLCLPGMFATKYAWEANRYKELGLPSEAKVLAKNAVCCIYTGLILGTVLGAIGLTLALVLN